LFAVLEPPRGGAARLRERLLSDAPSVALWPGTAAAGLAALTVLCALLFYVPAQHGERGATAMVDAPEFDRLLGREPAASALRVDVNAQMVQADPVQSSDPRVRIYTLR
jgi:hypothetical protein